MEIISENECAVCLTNMYADRCVTLQNCSHSFCRSCISEWICEKDSTCPCCRASFSSRDRVSGYNFGIMYGLLTPVYEMVIDFAAMNLTERFAFKYYFWKTALKMGLGDEIDNECMDISIFKEIMHELHLLENYGQKTIVAFNSKTDLKNKFLGYEKTRTYDECIKKTKQKKDLIILVRNFYN